VKNLFYLIIIALLMGGCSYKNEAIALQSYKAQYVGPVLKEKRSVHLNFVQDTRTDKRSIGYYLKNDEKSVRLYSDINFAEKYQEGLGYAFNIAGFNTDVNTDDASLIVEVYIKNIELIYNSKILNANLKGEIEIEVRIKKGEKVITQSFREKSTDWVKPSFNSKDLEPFLYTLFSDSINNIVSRLTRY
jgi:uncharacterized lipoprotein